VLDCDWVAVSHEHLDHLDLALLAGLPERDRVVIPRYPSPALVNRLNRAGVRHVIELDAWQRLP
jgi:L-ascorbate metabolism protein UlaG (beta-lactamase superfamily)